MENRPLPPSGRPGQAVDKCGNRGGRAGESRRWFSTGGVTPSCFRRDAAVTFPQERAVVHTTPHVFHRILGSYPQFALRKGSPVGNEHLSERTVAGESSSGQGCPGIVRRSTRQATKNGGARPPHAPPSGGGSALLSRRPPLVSKPSCLRCPDRLRRGRWRTVLRDPQSAEHHAQRIGHPGLVA